MAETNVLELSQALVELRKRLREETATDRREIQTALVGVKALSRSLHETAHVSKENVSGLRKQSDAAHLALQSVHYEKRHLEKELLDTLATECYEAVDFSVPPPASKTDPRATMQDKLERVKNEAALRHQHSQHVRELEAEVEATRTEVTALRDLLGGIPAKLVDIEKNMQTLERFMKMPSLSYQREMRERISKAAAPLLRLYTALEDAIRETAADVEAIVKEEPTLTIVLEFPGLAESLEFTFDANLGVVLVESMGAQDVLQGLFEQDDTGEVLPVIARAVKADPPSFTGSLKRPYMWAQSLAGIGDSSGKPDTTVSHGRDVLNALISRLRGRFNAQLPDASKTFE